MKPRPGAPTRRFGAVGQSRPSHKKLLNNISTPRLPILINRQLIVALPIIPPRRRPRPILRPLNQPSPNRIHMNIPDLFIEFRSAKNIPVIPASTLPEPCLSIACSEFLENSSIKFTPSMDYPMCKCAFHGLGDCRNWILRQSRPDQQVHMLRHDHPRKQVESHTIARSRNLFNECVFDSVILKQTEPSITRKCKIPRMVLVFESAHFGRVLLQDRL